MEGPSSQLPFVDRDLLIEQHASYVRAIAVGILSKMPPHIELDELVACGNLGLVRAAERFDPRRCVSFTTFAYYYIRGAIYDELRRMGFFSRKDYEAAKISANLNDILQTTVVEEQIGADILQTISIEDEVEQIQSEVGALIPAYLLSLNSCDESLAYIPELDTAEALEKEQLISYTMRLMAQLSTEDQQLLEQLYFKNRTAADIAAELGLSRSWVSRLHNKAINSLRALMIQHGVLNK